MIDFHDMFSSADNGFALRSRDGDTQPVLIGVRASGHLEGVLFTLCLRQTYRNTGSGPLEVVYSFPLPAGAVLLGCAAELAGRRLDGRVLPRRAAEADYETALAAGDAPVLLEASEGGLHSASIGHLMPGEWIVIEIRLAQLLNFEHGRLRLTLPTTIAPRHGRPARAGLLPHQVPEAGLEAGYPLSLGLQVAGALASACIECPTHSHQTTLVDGGVRLELAPGAVLDRDVVFTISPEPASAGLLIQGPDKIGAGLGAGVVALAAFELPAGRARPRTRLKLLVDCSGSMAGDGIDSARRALKGLVTGLRGNDALSFDRFGDLMQRVMALSEATPDTIRTLCRHIDETEASLGGTKMAAALLALIGADETRGSVATRTATNSPVDPRPDILLITDGAIWDSRGVVAAARRTGQRVFVIGVGSSPAEDVIRSLARATGGACEFATPGEGLEAAALRMLARIRQSARSELRVDWGAAPRWQLALPGAGYGGDTVLALAGFSAVQAPAGRVRLFANDEDGRAQELASARAGDLVAHPPARDELARIAAARRLPSLNNEQATTMALAYQLVSEHSHCVLVHRRADQDKAEDVAPLHRVRSMLAAGWGGTGSVAREARAGAPRFSRIPRTLPSIRSSTAWAAAGLLGPAEVLVRLPEGPPAANSESPSPPTLLDIAERVVRHLAQGHPMAALPTRLTAPTLHPALRRALTELRSLVSDEPLLWWTLALWVSQRVGDDGNPQHAAILARHAASLAPATQTRALELLDRRLGGYASGTWRSSRVRRLMRQMNST